ncbi:hypothetical protein HanIR_Chr05g0211831 [Helianthus annuus]|nr:hypothetical protein HanIR_Chr05g0211831 [Helianthus annuus]
MMKQSAVDLMFIAADVMFIAGRSDVYQAVFPASHSTQPPTLLLPILHIHNSKPR